jgi:DNA repair protein RecN (Recombination protein N)
MICSLHIKNYVLISELEINFEKGFTIITGETGAGKSIMLGALNLIAGQRADTAELLDKNNKCVIEAEFDISYLNLLPFFEDHNLDYNKRTIIRREISSNGKSRAFVNDTPVNLSNLKELCRHLIDIHSQHQSLGLNEKNTQLNYLDNIADNDSLIATYKNSYAIYKSLQQQLIQKTEEEKRLKKDVDYYQFQWQEIEDLKLKPNELSTIKAELAVMTHAEDIKINLQKANHILSQKDEHILAMLNECKQSLSAITKYNQQFEELHQRLQSAVIELKDISTELEQHLEQVSYDPVKLEYLNERQNSIERLLRKHAVNSEEELHLLMQDFETKINGVASVADEILAINKQLKDIEAALLKKARELEKNRKNAAPLFGKQVTDLLQQLGMPNANFTVQVNQLEELSPYGINDVDLLFSANKGVQPAPLGKVASGGELSRVMLAIKSMIAKKKTLPAIIFDEIDTGVSGDVAAKMAGILKDLSAHLQVISITHLPQIASKGKQHWYVYKNTASAVTTTHIKVLNKDERIHEIAKMLSNEKMTPAAITNAKELLGLQKK